MNSRCGSMFAAAALATALVLPTGALAAPGGGHGGGGGGGGGGGHPTDNTGSLYSDLVLALRAQNGTPILKKFVVPGETTEEPTTDEYCVQPISHVRVPGVAASSNPVDGREVWVLPLQGEWLTNPVDPLPVEEIEPCDPQPQYTMFVSEVELERLNLARTSAEVIASKLAEVETRLKLADAITLDGAGRVTTDGTPVDASPQHAAIYDSLMKTGTLPGLPSSMAGPPASIGIFDAWELAAAAIGTAAGKEVPIDIDTIQYYNRVIGYPPAAEAGATDYVSPWGVGFLRSEDPANPGTEMPTGERYVDYSHFGYNRSETFKGSVTWLDVPSLTWKVTRITDVVDFANKDEIGTSTLTGVKGFAQLADDVRAVILYLHENEVVPGFYMDPVGVDTTTAQEKAIKDPAVDLGTLPASAFRTVPFPMTASLFNPWGGSLIDEAQLRVTVDAAGGELAQGAVTATAADGQLVAFTAAGGDLVGTWGPATGFPVSPGYDISTTFDVTVAADAPVGDYNVTLQLVDVDDPSTVLAEDQGTLKVNDNVATVLWGGTLPKLATQGTPVKVPVQLYSPEGGVEQLTLTVTGPGDDQTTPDVVETLAAGDLRVYGDDGADMALMPLAVDDEGRLVGTWDVTVSAGFTDVTWYLTVREGALVGNYALEVALAGGNALDQAVVTVSAPESHGQEPPDGGGGDGDDSGDGDQDTTAPVASVTVNGELGSSASFTLTADEDVTFEHKLVVNGVETAWEPSTGTVSYTDLAPGTYVFYARAVDKAGNVSAVVERTWTVEEANEPEPPVPPETSVLEGPRDNAWVLARSATFRLGSDGTDVTYTVTVNGQTYPACESSVCVVEGLPSRTNRIRFAAESGGLVDATPAIRTVHVPRGVFEVRHSKAWRMLEGRRHLFGQFAQTRQQGQVIRTRSRQIKRLALVASMGPGHGRVMVFLDNRPLTSKPIVLRSSQARQKVLIPIRTFREARDGVVRVVVVSRNKVVRVDGVGIASR